LSDHASLHDQLQALVRDATNERRSKELTRIYRDAHRRIRDHQVKTVWKVDQAVVGNPKCDQRVMVRIAEGHPRKSVRQAALGNPSAPAHFKAMGALIQ
jgi:hypothetical protein